MLSVSVNTAQHRYMIPSPTNQKNHMFLLRLTIHIKTYAWS